MKNKRGVFGLTAIQSFFAILLAIALLAYIIVIIMGTLQGTTILTQVNGNSGSAIVNETLTTVTEKGDALTANSYSNCQATVTRVTNRSVSVPVITAGNYTVVGCIIYNTGTDTNYNNSDWNVTYTYKYDSTYQDNQEAVLTNVSTGVSGFFSSINPIYAILAVLVIVLVLVVLVRVVQAPNYSRGTGSGDSIL